MKLPIEVDPEILAGTPVIANTRVPVATLFDYLMDGFDLEEFLGTSRPSNARTRCGFSITPRHRPSPPLPDVPETGPSR